jgi:hypothetical protein
MKYIDDLSKLDRDAFIKELIFSAMIKFIKGLRQNLQNIPSHSSTQTLEEKTYEIINEYYNNISVDKDASYKISISNTKRLIYKGFLNNRKRVLSDTLLGIPTIILEEEKKEHLIRETVEKVFNNIIHITTKHPLEIIRYPEAGLVQVNGVFLPIDFLNELLSEQEEVLDRAMRNSCIFMNDYYNVHFDADYNKYLLPNDDIHVFGLTRDVKGYNKLIGYLKERVEKLPLGQVESLVEKPILSLFSPSEKQEVIDRYIESPSTKLNIELEKLMSANETTETVITSK